MNNRYFLISIALIISITCIESVLVDLKIIKTGLTSFGYGINIAGFIGLLMLFLNGTFRKTTYFKLAQGFFALILIGVILKLSHLGPYGNLIKMLGIIGFLCVYLWHFIQKPIKKRLDYLKVFWISLTFIFNILMFLHLINLDYTNITTCILWLAIIDFAISERKKRIISKNNSK